MNYNDSKNNKSYWSLVWRQFKKRKIALYSLWIILFFFFIGVFAPFLANKVPIAFYSSYEEFYQYRFLSWQKSHDNLVSAILERDKILKLQSEAKIEFEKLKKEIIELNKEKDEASNKRESLTEQIQILEKEKGDHKKKIEELKKQKKEYAVQLSKAKENSLIANNTKVEKNDILIQCKNRLNYENGFKTIKSSLEGMKFPVSSKIDTKIEAFINEYNLITESYNFDNFQNLKNPADLKKLILKLNEIGININQNLDKRAVLKEFEMLLTFPVLETLSVLDIVFISTFLFIIILPVINWLYNRYLAQKIYLKNSMLVFYIAFIAICVSIFLISSSYSIPVNYKKLFYENYIGQHEENSLQADINKALMEKKKDSFIVFPLVPYGFNENNVEEKRQEPSLLKYVSDEKYGRHLLGTDLTGRDVMSRMIWGARISLSVGFVAVSIYVFIGMIVGAIAGYFGGMVDMIISRIIEIVICFPSFFLILTIIAFIGPSIFNIMIVIGLTSWTGIARLVRGEFLKLRNQDYVIAGKALGLSNSKIIFKHILPNALTPVLVSATFGIASAILTEASLSFLGFGVREPFPSWGQMISIGQDDVFNFWWLSLIPGFAIFISVTTYNLVGDALREAIDPRLKE